MLHVAPDALVLVDPLVPDSLWPELDARIEAAGKPVVVLTTIHWHARNRDEVAKRYDARLQIRRGAGADAGEASAVLDLPIAIVLPAHGNAVLEGGSQALGKALGA